MARRVGSRASRIGSTLLACLPDRHHAPPDAAGKVFVEYDSKESAQRAALSLAGRQFGQNIVKVEYVNEDKFARRDLD